MSTGSPLGAQCLSAQGLHLDWSRQEAAHVSSVGVQEREELWEKAGAQISWSVLSLTLGSKEDLTRDEKRNVIPERGRECGLFLVKQGIWTHFQNRTAKTFA